jgi:hypothetical protein
MKNDDVIKENEENPNKYPQISGKYKTMFGIPNHALKILHKDLYDLYSHSHLRNLVKPKSLHNIITNLFINEYYPIISKQYHIDEKTKAILMGTIGFNMNIPSKLNKILYTDTDDIDLKIYTTKLHYDKSKNTPANVKSVLSLFRYIVITLFMFMKQVMAEVIDFSKNMFVATKPNYKKTRSQSQSITLQDGGDIKQLIKHTQKSYGIMNSGSIYIQIKKSSSKDMKEQINEKIDITKLSYEETYKLIVEKIDDVDLLITSKIKYWINYSKLLNIPKFVNALTFSDTKIYYPNLLENTTFYSYYLLNDKNNKQTNTQNNLTLDTLYNRNINITDIIKVKNCGKNNYNCNYIALNSLKLDLILMLQYAEFINDEEYENNNIIVPISSLFKYTKYLTKYLKLYLIIKYYNKTLNKDYMNTTMKLIKTINKLYNKTTIEPENSEINISYKKQINKIHQDFFIKQTMFPEYEIIREVVDDYNTITKYINKSRFLFKDLYKTYEKEHKSCNTNTVSLLNILNILFDTNTDTYTNKQEGGTHKCNKKHQYILYDNINDDISNELCELETDTNIASLKHTKKDKHTKKISSKAKTQLIIKNINNTLKNDIKHIKEISNSL